MADAQGPTGTALKPPTDFTWVWEIQRPELTLSIWRPQPPPGYVSMGLVCSNSPRAPDIATVKCVRQDLVIQAQVNKEVWNDRGTHASTNFSAWSISPPSPLPAEVFFSTGTFIGHDQYAAPSSVNNTYALRTHLSIQAPPEPSHAPVLQSYAQPSDHERTTATYTTFLPWFVISDPTLTPDQQFIRSPQYQLQRTEDYKLVRHAYNNTGDIQRYNWTIQSSKSASSTQTKTDTTGGELSVEATFATFFKSTAKSNFSVSQSNSITQGWTTSKTFTVWCTLGAYKAVAVYVISYTYRLLRANGDEVGKGLTHQSNNSLYWTQYPPAPKAVNIVETAQSQDAAFVQHE
ncbi:Vps62-related protein [Pseudomonas sp. MWU15-20650]|uniref:Vps62-related protein n=1 Tax=Pseudomonas sp. MWU15-20650 TaxID=2933107 RepID=UPI0020106F41